MESLTDSNILADRVAAALRGRPTAQKSMFGGRTFLLNGNMLCCASAKGLMVRVGAEAEANALKRTHVARCTGAGREIAGFLLVAPQGLVRERDLTAWLDCALAYVGQLPPKQPKPKKRAKRALKQGRAK